MNKTRKRGKKALSHIEVILSFSIFIIFVAFLFIIFNPLKRSTATSSLIDNVEYAVKNYISADVEVTSIIATDDIDETCIQIIGGGNNIIKKISSKYFYIYSTGTINSISVCQGDYQKGITRTEKIILRQKIEKLKQDYDTDYSALRQNMGISNSNFNVIFNITTEAELITAGGFLPSGISIFAREIPIIVMDSNGEFKEGYMNLRVW